MPKLIFTKKKKPTIVFTRKKKPTIILKKDKQEETFNPMKGNTVIV